MAREIVTLPRASAKHIRIGVVAMLAVLVWAFALSNAFRTLPTIVASGLAADFALGTQQLGLFAALFHISFAAMQMPVGIALDRFGTRRTVAALFVVAAAGALIASTAQGYLMVIVGQLLIGAGCSPALMGAMVFIARHYSQQQFARISGAVLAAGGLGMLITATPLAWVVEQGTWRTAFGLLGALSASAAALCWFLVDDGKKAPDVPGEPKETLASAMRGLGRVLREPQTPGILALGLVTYASALTLRGLWIVPLFAQRHDLSLVQSGNVVLWVSLAMIVGPMIFGWLDPGPKRRRRVIVAAALVSAALVAILAVGTGSAMLDAAFAVAFGGTTSYYVLQFADVRSSYPAALAGRALSALNLAVFLGVSLVQFGTGALAEVALAYDLDAQVAVLASLAALLAAGAGAFVALAPRGTNG
jgi:predicted MFS family arabinose efflux permease